MTHKAYITGFGAVTATAMDVQGTWQAVKEGKSGVRPLTLWDTEGWEHNLAAELAAYKPREMIDDRKLLKVLSRQDVIGLAAARQCLSHSGLLDYQRSLSDAQDFNDNTGVFVGSPGNKFQQQYDFMPVLDSAQEDWSQFSTRLFEQVHPMWLLRILPNNVLAYTGIQYGFKGPNHNITNHVVSGVQAIIEAVDHIQSGTIDRAIVISYDTGFEPQGLLHYEALQILSKTGIRSFSSDRDGTILGEGAGAIVIESDRSAAARNATIYGEVLAGSSSSEAQGIFSLDALGEGMAKTGANALEKAGLQASDIGLITAHANGTRISDAADALSIAQLTGDRAVPVTGFKWSIGHTLSGAGVIETILTLLSLRENVAPGIPSLQSKAHDCANVNVSCDNQSTLSNIGVVMSRGFGSLNACLVIKS